MKAITIKQPWATLIALGEKRFETRSWATKYRGKLAIHAGKKVDKEICKQEPFRSVLAKHGYTADHLPTGAVVAITNLTECWSVGEDYQNGMPVLYNGGNGATRVVGLLEERFGDYSLGRKAWELANVQRLPEPIPAKGMQGLWNWSCG